MVGGAGRFAGSWVLGPWLRESISVLLFRIQEENICLKFGGVMFKKMRVLMVVCLSVALVACGGGSSVDSTPTPTPTPAPAPAPTPTPVLPSFSGSYAVNMSAITTCGGVFYPRTGIAVVTQNGQNITYYQSNMTNGKGVAADTLSGALDADNNGFTASITFGDSFSSSGKFTNTVTFRNTATSGTYSAYVSLKQSYSTSSGCESTYSGTMTKI